MPNKRREPVFIMSSRAGNIRVKAVRTGGLADLGFISPPIPQKCSRINTIPFLEILGQ